MPRSRASLARWQVGHSPPEDRGFAPCRPGQSSELLAEGEVLEGELGAGLEGGAEAGEQVEKQGEHGKVAHDAISPLPLLRILALTDGEPGFRMRTWRRTGGCPGVSDNRD